MKQSEQEDILNLAQLHYNLRKQSERYVNGFQFGSFLLEIPHRDDIKEARVDVAYGDIREIKIFFQDGSYEFIRPAKERSANG